MMVSRLAEADSSTFVEFWIMGFLGLILFQFFATLRNFR
jgi:hypothetical protein